MYFVEIVELIFNDLYVKKTTNKDRVSISNFVNDSENFIFTFFVLY